MLRVESVVTPDDILISSRFLEGGGTAKEWEKWVKLSALLINLFKASIVGSFSCSRLQYLMLCYAHYKTNLVPVDVKFNMN